MRIPLPSGHVLGVCRRKGTGQMQRVGIGGERGGQVDHTNDGVDGRLPSGRVIIPRVHIGGPVHIVVEDC